MRKTRSTKNKFQWNKVQRFSIRKFSFGVASCMIGAQFVLSGLPNTVEAAFKQLNGEDGIVSLYSNSGETPESADGIEIRSKVNVDKEIGIDVDWSEYTRENPIVKVTYTYNGGADGSSVAGFGGHRPRFWFTTPIGLKEPKEITLKKNDGRPAYVMKTWEGKQKFTSLSNSVNSRFQTEDDINRAYREIDFRGNDTKWESYNDTTGESHREYSGSFADKFWYHIGERISDDPYEQAIFEHFRTNTKTMYVDWERGGIERATITAVYEVADPTFGNDRSTLEFGAGIRVGIARMMQHYKTVLAPVPSLYKLNEIFEPSVPTRVAVKDTNKLTEAEKNIVRDRIWNANKENVTSVARTGKNKLIENLKSEDKTESILIDDDGTATIIYSDNTRDVIPGTSLVYKVTETNTHRQGGGYEYDIAPVPVKNIDQITEEEKKAAIKSFLKANGIGVENLQYHSGKSDLDYGNSFTDEHGNKWFAYEDNIANAKNIGTHIGTKENSSTVMLSRDAGNSGLYTIPTSDLYYKEGTSALDLAKKDAEAAIDNLNYLSPKEKQAFKEKLKDKTTQESVNAVVEEAVAKNSENEKALEAKKREVKEKINNNPYLTTAEKKELVDQVSAVVMTDPTEGTATPIEHTKGLVDRILDKALEKTKEKAKAIIDEIDKNGGQAGYLENPTAAQYKEQIQNATTQEAITKVIEDAQNQKSKKAHDAEKAKTDALKDEYKKKIDQVPGLTDAQKDEYKKQIDAATTRDQLEDIVKDAEVKAYRDTAKAKIDALEHLNAAQKAELKTQVDAAGNKAEVDNIVSIAQGLDSKMDSLQKLVEKAKAIKGSEKYNTATQDKKDAFDTANAAASKVADKTTAEPENAAGTSEVATLIDNLAKAIEALTGEKVAVPVSKDALKAEIDLNTDDAVKKSPAYAKEKDAAKKKAYDDALANAQKVYDNPDATQPQVDEALDTLKQARLALSGKAEDFTLGVKDGAAKISVEPKAGEKLADADKDAVKAKVTANGKELDNTYTVEYGTIAEKNGKKVVPVTVTHDGITRTVDVPVEGNTAATTTPTADTAKLSETPKVNDTITKPEDVKAIEDAVKVTVPAGQKEPTKALVDNGKVVEGTDQTANGGANNTGKPVVKVEVTYADGSKDVVEVPVEGNTAATTTPTADTAKLSETPKVNDTITKADDVKAIKDAVKVTVPAGQTEPTKALVDNGKVVEGTDQTANGGANNTGKQVVKVEVTYADGSKDVVEVPVEGNTAATTTPTADTAKLSETPKVNDTITKADDVKAIKDAVKVTVPAGQTEPTKALVDDGKVVEGTDQTANGGANNTGKQVVKVEVTYADGSKDVVEVPVEGNTAATTTPTADTAKLSETPKVNDTITKAEDVKAIKDAVKVTVPEGQTEPTKALVDNGKVVEGTDQTANGGANNTGKQVVKVEVTYADGSKDVVEVPVEGNTAATTTPTADTAKLSETPKVDDTITKPEDVKAIKDAVKVTVPAGQTEPTKALVDNGKVVEGTDQTANGGANNAGKPVVKVEVTYADGSKDVVEVPVEGTDAAKATPKVKKEITSGEVPVSVDPETDKKVAETDKKAITDAVEVPEGQPQPTDKQVKNDGAIVEGTGANAGKKVVVVEVTYPDGSKDEIEVPVRKATDKDKAKADLTKAADAEKAEIDEDNALSKKEKEALKAKVDELKAKHEENINNATSPEAIALATEKGKQEIAAVHTPQDITETAKRRLNPPKEKVKVTDINHLTDAEKDAVKEAIVATNPSLEESEVLVDDKGNVSSPKGILEAEKVVTQALNKPATPVVVADPNHLTNDEKEKVKEAVANANPGLNKDDITVDDKGNVTTKNGDKLLAKDVVTPALKKPTTPVVVGNPDALTDKEKEDIKDAVVAENPGLNKGDVTVNPDGSVTTPKGNLPKEDVVTTVLNKPADPVVVSNPNSLTDKEKDKVKDAVAKANPGLDKKDIKVDDQGNVETPKGNLPAKDVVTPGLKKPTIPVKVNDPSKLTEPEKSKVVEEIIKNNPGLTDKDIKVDDQGNVETPKGNLPAGDVVAPSLKKPTTPVVVKNPDQLTNEEKEAIKKAVAEANPGLDKKDITVDNQGNVTTPNGNLPKEDVVTIVLNKPTAPVVVKNPNSLTDEEKDKVKDAVAKANPGLDKKDITVDNQGNVETPNGGLPAKDVITPDLKKPTTLVEVKDPNNLTEKEKEEVKKVVVEANPGLDKKDIKVDNQGNVETPKGNLPAGDVVTPVLNVPTKPIVVGNPESLTDKEKEAVKDAVSEANPGLDKKDITVDNQGNVTTPKGNLPTEYIVKVSKGESVTRPALPELSIQDALVAGEVAVEKGKDLTDEDVLKQLTLVEGVTAKVISKPNTTETGTKEAEVEITLANGNKVTVKVPVVVYEGERPEVNDLGKAKEAAKKQVEEAAKAKIDEIKNNKELTAEQKQKAEDAINKAKEAADKAIDEATSAGTAKAIGKEAADNIKQFDPKATPAEGVKPVDPSKLDEEKAKAIAEIEQAAKDQTDAIKNNPGLTQEQKDRAIKEIEKLKAKAIEEVRKADSVGKVKDIVEKVESDIKDVNPQPIPTPQPQPENNGGNSGTGGNNTGNGSNQNAQANSDAVDYAKQAAKNILEEAARAKKAQLEEAELSADEKAELFAKVDAEKQAALDEIAKAKDVDTVKQLVTKAVAKIKAIQPVRNAQDNQDSQDAQDAQNNSNSNPTSLDAANVRGQELPATGTGSEFVVFNAAAISILTGLGLAIPSKKKETEK